MAIHVLLAAILGGDVDRLGSDRWEAREAAHDRLRSWGPLAWPVLGRAAGSECPEVRDRADRLLTPQRRFEADLRAAAVLTGHLDTHPSLLWSDTQLRLRVHRLAVAAGLDEYQAKPLHPDSDEERDNWWGTPPWWGFQVALGAARARVQGDHVAPMPREVVQP